MWDASTTPPASEPGPLDDGLLLALRAQQGGGLKPLIDWLARHPEHAADLAKFLDMEERFKAALPVVAGPARIPGLELFEEIGRGAFGVVHRAHDLGLNKPVAVKIVHALGEEGRTRFRREVEAAAGLDHPNVVPVYSSGEAGGVPYLVMKLVPGGSLAGWLHARGPDRLLTPRRAAEIVRGIALGTHAAHQRGLIHRDLKPGNVLLDGEVPRIADFGLARPADVSITGPAGTPAYMAPEQVRGDRRLTPAVDVWALGVILYELLAGRPPFRGVDVASITRRIIEEPVPPLRRDRPDLHPDLEEVCMRCLERSPEDRYPSAQDLADDLARFLAGEPAAGRPGGWWGTVHRALVTRRETDAMGTWHVLLWGAASAVFAMGWLQAAVTLSAPPWVGWAAVAYYLLAWAGILWGLLFVRWGRLNVVEKHSTLLQGAIVLACAACLPGQAGPGGDVVRLLPVFLTIKGLGIFVHGQWYWGWLYLVGMLYFALGALMPLLPPAVWPTAFGLSSGGFQLWVALHLRRVHLEAAAAR